MIKRPGIWSVLLLYALIIYPGSILGASDLGTSQLNAPNHQTLATNESTRLKQHLVETAYKRYSLYRYKDLEILCEPYTVKQGDWVYRIFRSKGELSTKDFSMFVNIFQEINPDIKNMDHIRPGQVILIPLKRTNVHDFNQSEPGIVDVPIIKFFQLPDKFDDFVTPYVVQEGDAVSMLLHPAFFNRGKEISAKGELAFKLVNPNVTSMDLILVGSTIYLPDPSIQEQPWFETLLKNGEKLSSENDHTLSSPDLQYEETLLGEDPSKGSPSTLNTAPLTTPSTDRQTQKISLKKSSRQSKKKTPPKASLETAAPKQSKPPPAPSTAIPFKIEHLREVAEKHGGRLMAKGRYFLPAKTGKDIVLDLESTPMIRLANGTRLLIVPDKKQYALLGQRLSGSLRHTVKMMDFNEMAQIFQKSELITAHSDPTNPYIGKTFRQKDTPDELNRSEHLTTAMSHSNSSHDRSPDTPKRGKSIGYSKRSKTENDAITYIPISERLPRYQKSLVRRLLESAQYAYMPNTEIKLPIDQIEVPVSVGMIVRSDQPDIILLFGTVYGAILESFRKKNPAQIITLPSQAHPYETIQTLFSSLGAAISRNPSFISPRDRRVISIPGIYINTPHRDIFISEKPLIMKEAFDYLNGKNIHLLTLSP